jgi:hypothetical protein
MTHGPVSERKDDFANNPALSYNFARTLAPGAHDGSGKYRGGANESKMATHTIGQAHRDPTRLAGIMYLLTMATANFADFYVRRQLFVPADPRQTLRNIAASGLLVRLGIVSDLITIAASVILVVASRVTFLEHWPCGEFFRH